MKIPERFQIEEVLGFGGMGTVYRAFDTVAQRDVAIKVLHSHLREHPVISARFRQEYAISQALEHPHIIRIHALIDTPSTLALVMELHGECDLKAYVQQHGKMEPRQVVEIADQVLSALEAAHALPIVHQDIKPHNILWDARTNTAKLIDFGLAEFGEDVALARPESAIATVEYSAPEQFDDFGSDGRADLYSLAITLFELLSKTLPYRAETAASIIQMHREAPVADVRVFVRAVPDYIAQILLRGMAKNPEDRFENATEMRDAFANRAQHELARPAQSPVWEDFKTFYRNQRERSENLHAENGLQKSWNLYLPPFSVASLAGKDDQESRAYSKRFIETFVRLFRKYPGSYFGLLSLSASNVVERIEETPGDCFAALFANASDSSEQHVGLAIPLARGLSFEQAESMRYELGLAGVGVVRFPFGFEQDSSRLAARMKRLYRFRRLPRFFNFFTLLAAVAASFVAVLIASAQNIPVLAMLTLFGWLLILVRTGFAGALHVFTPADSVARYPELFEASAYLLQFTENKEEPPESGLLGEIHATTYLQLRSARVQSLYERIVLKLLEVQHANADSVETSTNVENILSQATRLAARMIELERQLSGQNYPGLFEQFARIDGEISRAGEVDEVGELIEQKAVLRERLDQIDAGRLELKRLASELSVIAGSMGRV